LRLVLRRSFGFNDEYGWNLDFASIIEGHAQHLKPLFPHLQEGVGTTIAVLDEEISKYRNTQKKAKGKVASLVQRASRDQRGISLEELSTLYTSDGIPPETVQSVAKEQNITIKIPDDFYSKIRHVDEETAKKSTIDVLGLPKTKMLCYEDELKFEGKILAIKDGWIILDKTAFYAESGGQVSDDGTLNGQKVMEVKKEAGVVLHKVEHPQKFIVGDSAIGEILAEKRRQITAHHTGAHVLNAAARDVLGMHIWQCGSNKDEFKAHLDLTHYKRISDAELEKIELRANQIIADNLPVTKKIYPRAEAEEKFGFRIYQGGAVPGLELRIISIGNIDHQACGGTHVNRTGDIGLFKIVKRESVQDGVERVTFKCYLAALKYVQERENALASLADQLSVPQKQLVPSVMRFFEEWKERGKKLAKLEEKYATFFANEQIAQAKKENRLIVECLKTDWDQKTCDMVANYIASQGLSCIISNKDNFIVAAVPASSSENALEILKSKGAAGGGDAKLARGKIK
jgi:alanyl-tRNA synthetase